MNGNDHYMLTYLLKEGTSTSYYLAQGERLLPGRVSISFDEFTPIQSRQLPEMKVGQMKGRFRVTESSPYRSVKGAIHTTIWKQPIKSSSAILGTGDLKDTSTLLIFEKLEDGKKIRIHLYPGGKFQKQGILQRLSNDKTPNR